MAANIGFGVPVAVKGDPKTDLTVYTEEFILIEDAISCGRLEKDAAIEMILDI